LSPTTSGTTTRGCRAGEGLADGEEGFAVVVGEELGTETELATTGVCGTGLRVGSAGCPWQAVSMSTPMSTAILDSLTCA